MIYYLLMERVVTRTVSLKLVEPPEALGNTIDSFAQACNYVSKVAFDSDCLSQKLALHRLTYKDIRARFPLTAQMACSVIRQVSGTYTSMKSNGQRHLATFKPTSILLQGGERGRDFRLIPKSQTVSISTIERRIKCPYALGAHQAKYLTDGWDVGAATLIRRKRGIFLNVTLSKVVNAPELKDVATIIGCDMGQRFIAVTSTGKFFGGGRIKNRKHHYRRVRKSLQAKGTKGAKRTLKRLSGREQRFQTDANHFISKAIVNEALEYPRPAIALEDLSGIRESTKHRRAQRGDFHSWAFYQLRQFLEYKGEAAGVVVQCVNPRNTSKTCSRCGHLEGGQRNGLDLKCKACGFQLHSDLNASRNIANFLRLSRQDLERLGPKSTAPEISLDPLGLGRDKLPALAGSG